MIQGGPYQGSPDIAQPVRRQDSNAAPGQVAVTSAGRVIERAIDLNSNGPDHAVIQDCYQARLIGLAVTWLCVKVRPERKVPQVLHVFGGAAPVRVRQIHRRVHPGQLFDVSQHRTPDPTSDRLDRPVVPA
jgi:hypothetical protein